MLNLHNLYDVVKQLTSPVTNDFATPRMLNDFASELGWQPSDQIRVPATADFANAHLLVEHGLENSAVITFLRGSWRDLAMSDQKRLLTISYNNLVDWHIQVQSEEVTYVYNRTSPVRVQTFPVSRTDVERLRSQAFEQIIGKRPNPNLPALDDALIDRISFWKRNLAAELGEPRLQNEAISTLFNTIIFIRAIEDWRRLPLIPDTSSSPFETLLDAWVAARESQSTLHEVLYRVLVRLTGETVPSYIGREDLLHAFDSLNHSTAFSLLADFYRNRYYDYDFSLMSKRAF